ncbi:MAG TPA: HNH endonuclease [Candidatus Acidoferrales bacterium]|nr:HNH endonuclease [Candidatus Acidoferrales bacterium]
MAEKKVDVENELIKEAIEYSKKHKPTPEEVKSKKEWQKRRKQVCKPCWELKYCPYGPLVEDFPSLGPTREEAIEGHEFVKGQLKKGAYVGWRKQYLQDEVKSFDPRKYPEQHKKEEIEKSCTIFGHTCPVFFVNEPFTETTEMRRISRNIPRSTMLRVARRDNCTCQICGKTVLDNEIEFDHVIPLSKGGSTEENNLQVSCLDCNRKKSSRF